MVLQTLNCQKIKHIFNCQFMSTLTKILYIIVIFILEQWPRPVIPSTHFFHKYKSTGVTHLDCIEKFVLFREIKYIWLIKSQ